MYTTKEAAIIVVIIALIFLGIGTYLGYSIWGSNPSIAPTYALDKGCIEQNGAYYPCSSSFLEILNKNGQGKATDFSDFWQEATKNTTYTIDGKPVEITDMQVFYKQTTNNIQWYHYTTTEDWLSFLRNHPNITWDVNAWTGPDGNWIAYTEQNTLYGNISYYPSGIENSQTYFAPIDISIKWSSSQNGNWTIINESVVAPTPIICPTPRSSCLSRSCHDIITAPPCYIAPTPIPSCTIHIDTFDKFPPMEMPCPAPTPTPTPVFAFPYEFCANGCVICTDHLGNCTYIPGK